MAVLVGVTIALVVAGVLLFVGALWAVRHKDRGTRGR